MSERGLIDVISVLRIHSVDHHCQTTSLIIVPLMTSAGHCVYLSLCACLNSIPVCLFTCRGVRQVFSVFLLMLKFTLNLCSETVSAESHTHIMLSIRIPLLSHKRGDVFITAAKGQNITKNNNSSKKIKPNHKKVPSRIDLYIHIHMILYKTNSSEFLFTNTNIKYGC